MKELKNVELFDSAPVAMVVTDRLGTIRFMNRQASALVGISPGKSAVLNICDFIYSPPLNTNGKSELSFEEFLEVYSRDPRQWIISRDGIKTYVELKGAPCTQDSEFCYIWSLVSAEPARSLAIDLIERVKEQLSIFNVIEAFFQSKDLRTALDLSLKAIQRGWQFPEATGVRIKLYNNEEFVTEAFRQSKWRLAENIITGNKWLGSLEVVYSPEMQAYDEPVFLPEEERLIKLLAKLLGVLIDHWESDNKIQEAEASLKAVFESATDSYLLADTKLNIRAFNAKAKDLVNTRSFELEEGRNVRDYLEPDRAAFFADTFKKVKKGSVVEYEHSHESGGALRWIHYTIFPVKKDNAVIGICMVGRDDTDKVTVHNRLKMSERMYKTLVQEGSDLINIVDHEGNYKHITQASNSMLALKSIDFIGKNAFDFVHPEDKARLKEEFDSLHEVKRAKSSPYRFNVGNNQYRWMETTATNLTDDPAIDGIVINSHDITDTIHHLHAIERQNQVLQEISWIQSHQVRAPLSNILALISLITEDLQNPRLSQLLQLLKESADRLDTIVKETVKKAEVLEANTKT
jgi:PAS domain S-box-containing protein